MKKILVIGSGAREHAIAQHLCQNPNVDQVFVAPGNSGMSLMGPIEVCSNLHWSKTESIIQFCHEEKISWVFVSPDNALAEGLVDKLLAANIKAFGPSQKASQIESSKIFAKEVMKKAKIPTAHVLFSGSWKDVKLFLESQTDESLPLVLKADGLAFGKGVIVCQNLDEAKAGILKLKDHQYILVEECLIGKEVSFFYFASGVDSLFLGAACDYKRLLDHDKGPNTGGMGAFSYNPEPELEHQIRQTIVTPVLRQLSFQDSPFHGILFVGLMITENGPRVIEFNARLGDPETQCLLPLFSQGCLLETFEAVVNRDLKNHDPNWLKRDQCSVHVVKVSAGYPSSEMVLGKPISGLNTLLDLNPDEVYFFSAGIRREGDHWYNAGGRVFGVTGVADSYEEARSLAYSHIEKICFDQNMYRKDIGCKR